MGLHDFRRSAATHLAMDAPDKIGLIPGLLQHTSAEISEQHYILARGIKASQRFAAHRTETKNRLRLFAMESANKNKRQAEPRSRDPVRE